MIRVIVNVLIYFPTSPTQLYRLLDQTNTNNSIDQMAKLLAALDCYVDVVFKKEA